MKLGHDTPEPVGSLEERDAVDRVYERPVEDSPARGIAGAAGTVDVVRAALKPPYVGTIEQKPT